MEAEGNNPLIQNADDGDDVNGDDVNGDVNDNVDNNQNVKEDVTKSGKKIVDKLLKANEKLRAFKITIETQIESLILLVNNTKALNTRQQGKIENQLLSMQEELKEKTELLNKSQINESNLNKQLESISAEVNKLEKNIMDLLDTNETQKGKIDAIQKGKIDANSAPNDVKSGGYQYKNPRSKRKLNKNNRFGVLKTKSKSKSKKGKKKRKLGKGKKSMRGGMKKRTKSKRKSKNSKKTRKRRKKNKRK